MKESVIFHRGKYSSAVSESHDVKSSTVCCLSNYMKYGFMLAIDFKEYMENPLGISNGSRNVNNMKITVQGIPSTEVCNIDLSFLYTLMNGYI